MAYLGKTVIREMHFGAKPEIFKRAADMRKNPTNAESILWNILRRYRKQGFIFRQQHPIAIFIADFYCHKLKLVVEVDGEVHFSEEAIEHDDGRTGELERFGLHVLRVTNEQVLYQIDEVIKQIDLLIEQG